MSSGSLFSLHCREEWARGFPCCVHCQAPVGRKSPAEAWEHKGWFRSSRSSLGTTWQRLSMGRNVLRASGLLLAPGVAAGCTWSITLGAQPQLCSSLPVWLSPLQKKLPFCSARSSPQHELSSLSQLVLPLTICLLMQPDGLSSLTLHVGTSSSLHSENRLV